MTSNHTPDEQARLAALHGYNVLDTPPEAVFDDLARVAALVCGTPIAVVSLVDKARQWFKARFGIDATETPRSIAFCDHAIREPNSILIVPDATADPRFCENPLVTGDTHIRFYAGAPLVTPSGHAVGTLCTIDQRPRNLTPEQSDALSVLARQVIAQLELRRSVVELMKTNAGLRETLERGRLPVECAIRVCAWTQTLQIGGGPWVSVEQFLRDTIGVEVIHGLSDEAARVLGKSAKS